MDNIEKREYIYNLVMFGLGKDENLFFKVN